MIDPNAEFWDKQGAAFTAHDGRRRSYHAEFAATLNRELSGDVLCVGGLYQNADLGGGQRFSVVDVSEQMLHVWAARGAQVQVGDARRLPVAAGSVDHVVFPLVLHHITDGRATASRQNVAACLGEASRVLRPGGTVWAVEILVSAAIYGAELALAPLTRAVLATQGVPLVIFHSRHFYLSQLAASGFVDASLRYSHADEGRWYDMIQPVVGLGLRVPKLLVPVKYGLLRGVKPR